MNRSNYQCPPKPQTCCCTCSKNENSSRSSRGMKYTESSPNEDDEDDEDYCNRTFRDNAQTYTRDDLYDNLIDLIDDQMMSTMSTLRKKARRFMKSELEQSFSSDTTSRPCTCPEEIRSRGTNVEKKANEIDYQPKSRFLKKMVQQYQGKQSDYSELDDSDPSPACMTRSKSTKKPRKKPQVRPEPVAEQGNVPSSCCCKCPKTPPDEVKVEQGEKQKKSEHLSRSKKKIKCRGKRKRKSDGKCELGDRFEASLKHPHENSCERCWRFASPSRSPVNKPDQRYDPNFRKGHSCTSLGLEKPEDLIDEKASRTSPCKNLQPVSITSTAPKSLQPVSTLQIPAQKKSVQIHNPPCSPQYNSLGEPKATPFPLQNHQQMQPYTEVRELEFEYPTSRSPETAQTQQQKCTPRPHTCEKSKQRPSLEKGISSSCTPRKQLIRPQSYNPSSCNYDKEDGYSAFISSLPHTDVCGRGRPENIDPCMKRTSPAKMESPCQEMSVLRGNGSKGSGLGSRIGVGLDTSRGAGLDGMVNKDDKSDFHKSLQNEIDVGVDAEERRRSSDDRHSLASSVPREFLTSTPKKPKTGEGREKTAKKKSPTPKKSPKSKSPPKSPKSPKGSPRGSKDQKVSPLGSRKPPCSTNEVQAYFELPSKPESSDKCGVSHPIRNCQCFPRATKKNGPDSDVYCCHCDWQEQPKFAPKRLDFDQVDNPPPNGDFFSPHPSPPANGGCCSQRPSPPANGGYSSHRPSPPQPSTSQGRRLSPIANRIHNQGPTLPNIDEYPEQFFEDSSIGANYPGLVLPCPYRLYMNNKLLNKNIGGQQLGSESSYVSPRNGNVCPRNVSTSPRNGNGNVYPRNVMNVSPRNGNASPRNGNVSPRNGNGNVCPRNVNISGNANVPNVNGNGSVRPRYGNGNASHVNYNMAPQMNPGYGMDYPRKYCVMYMMKGDHNTGDDVEVLVEELTQPCPYETDERMMDVSEKMTRVFKCPTESMALRFQKGVSESRKVPQKSRVLYF